ncbi:MAG TPA: multicopper oxidase [Terriglobales bacterium]|nr:multicopper oxidase [Terriglobales bacterium]
MAFSRRLFLKQTAAVAGALAMPKTNHTAHSQTTARPVLDLKGVAAFVDPLPIPPVAQSSGTKPVPGRASLHMPYYRIAMRQFQTKVHRDLQSTRLWGFEGGSPGPTLETRSGQGMLVEWANDLPQAHFLPIDHGIHGAEKDKPDVRAVVHLHGGKVGPESDGYPEDWYTPGKSATYFYPNEQDAAMLWYHDHTLGINRLNVFAGLFGVYLIRDKVEEALDLPRGRYEIPLVICDRMFDKDAQLYYPVSEDPHGVWISEFAGDAFLVNGKLLPYLEVEPRKYRFRVLNASNSRFFDLKLSNGQEFHQIGSDQGLLPAPVPLKDLQLAPAERADLIVDFAGRAGEQIILKNESFQVLQFRVAKLAVAPEKPLPATLRSVARIAESSAIRTRELALVEVDDQIARPMQMLLNNARWHDPITEKPLLDSVEIWSLINTSDDSHPIHLHLVKFQVLDRRNFERFAYTSKGVLRYLGPVTPPDPNEMGWKDTVTAPAGMVTRIIVRFEGFTGRYVWHCHILEHEDNEMMRPYDVVPAK